MKKLIPAAAYLRMSTDKQDKSIADQLTEVKKLAEKLGYEIIRWKEYVDEGISGWSESRTGFQKLIHDVQTIRDFEAVLLWSQDRFSRLDILDAATYWKILRDAEVKMITVCEGERSFTDLQGVLMACISQHGASDYLKKLAISSSRGVKSAAREGYWAGGKVPFGYQVVPDSVNPKRKRLAIDENSAGYVREAFQRVLRSDCSLRAIAEWLNSCGLKTSRGNPWSGSALARLFANEAYLGTLIHGKTCCGKHVRVIAGEYVHINKRGSKPVKQKKADCIVTENAHPQVIDKATFDLVQAKLSRRAANQRKPRTKCSPLSGLLYCGHCGKKMGATTAKTSKAGRVSRGYACISRNEPGGATKEECRCRLSMERVIDEVIARIESEHLSDSMLTKYRNAISSYLLGRRQERDKTSASNKKALEDVIKKLSKAEERLLETPDDMLPALYRQIRILQEKRQQIEADSAASIGAATVSEAAVAAEANSLVATMKRLREDVRNDDPAVVRAAIEAIVDRIEVWSKPVAESDRICPAHRRSLARIRIAYKSPICTMETIGTNRLHYDLSVKQGILGEKQLDSLS